MAEPASWRRRLTMVVAVALMSLSALTVTGSTAKLAGSDTVTTNNFSTGAIGAATAVSATTSGPGMFSLSWTQSASTYAAGYDIYRATASAGPWTKVGSVTGRATTTYVDGVPSDGQWYYKVNTTFNNWTRYSAVYTAPAVQLHPIGTWGRGGSGEIGNGAFNDQTQFTGMLGPAGQTLTAITGGSGFSCGIFAGSAYCWGKDTEGELGDGGTTNSATAVAVLDGAMPANATINKISAGSVSACALTGGKVYCWGKGNDGELGNGQTPATSGTPVLVGGQLAGKTVSDISVGNGYACAIAAGAAYCWGANVNGELGTGNTTYLSAPAKVVSTGVLSGKTVTAISAGGYHTCVIASGAAYCWGLNGTGQLGNGDGPLPAADSYVPVAVIAPLPTTVSAISSGYYSTCALASGVPYCWGNGGDGNIGNGANTNTSTPVKVVTTGVLSGKTITSLSSGYSHVCVIASSKIVCWGNNGYGQLGDGTTTSRNLPVNSNGPTVTALESGYDMTVAMTP